MFGATDVLYFAVSYAEYAYGCQAGLATVGWQQSASNWETRKLQAAQQSLQ